MESHSKSELREEARTRRRALEVPDFAVRVAAHAGTLGLEAGTIVGGYAALPGEADPQRLLARLEEMGCVIAFPRVTAKDAPLSFHLIPEGRGLAKGAFGVPEPSPAWLAARPQILLVPLLAFDAAGYRLGYGGGHYDRTLAELKSSHPVRAAGIAYAGQETRMLPHDTHDQPLDLVVTEQGVRHFR